MEDIILHPEYDLALKLMMSANKNLAKDIVMFLSSMPKEVKQGLKDFLKLYPSHIEGDAPEDNENVKQEFFAQEHIWMVELRLNLLCITRKGLDNNREIQLNVEPTNLVIRDVFGLEYPSDTLKLGYFCKEVPANEGEMNFVEFDMVLFYDEEYNVQAQTFYNSYMRTIKHYGIMSFKQTEVDLPSVLSKAEKKQLAKENDEGYQIEHVERIYEDDEQQK